MEYDKSAKMEGHVVPNASLPPHVQRMIYEKKLRQYQEEIQPCVTAMAHLHSLFCHPSYVLTGSMIEFYEWRWTDEHAKECYALWESVIYEIKNRIFGKEQV